MRYGLNPTVGGISMKWRSQSLEGKCTCGAQSTAKARFSKSWSSPNATRPRRCGCCGNCFRRQGCVPTVIVTDKLRSYGTRQRQVERSQPQPQPKVVEDWGVNTLLRASGAVW